MNEDAREEGSVLGKAIGTVAIGGGIYGTHRGLRSDTAYNWGSKKASQGSVVGKGIVKYNEKAESLKNYLGNKYHARYGYGSNVHGSYTQGGTSNVHESYTQGGTPSTMTTGLLSKTDDSLMIPKENPISNKQANDILTKERSPIYSQTVAADEYSSAIGKSGREALYDSHNKDNFVNIVSKIDDSPKVNPNKVRATGNGAGGTILFEGNPLIGGKNKNLTAEMRYNYADTYKKPLISKAKSAKKFVKKL